MPNALPSSGLNVLGGPVCYIKDGSGWTQPLAPAAGRTVTKLPGHCQSFDRGPKGQSGDGGACGALQVWLHRVGSSP